MHHPLNPRGDAPTPDALACDPHRRSYHNIHTWCFEESLVHIRRNSPSWTGPNHVSVAKSWFKLEHGKVGVLGSDSTSESFLELALRDCWTCLV